MALTYSVYATGKHYYDERINENKTRPKVYDLGHRYMPDWHDMKIANVLMDVLPILPLFLGWNVVYTFLGYIPFLFMIRWITTLVTILPKYKKCDDSKFTMSLGLFGHCYDKIFSGHFAVSVLLSCIVYSKGIISNLWIIIIYNFLVAFLIIATRAHYTIDIIVSIFVVFVVYQNRLHI
jgi:hypothetical protein